MRRLTLQLPATVALMCAVPSVGFAQDDADLAIELFEDAIELYRAESYAEAATMFETAYGYDPSPRIAYNAGRAHELANHLPTALEWYVLALAEEDPALEELVEEAWNGIDQQLGVAFVASFGRGDLSEDGVLYVLFDEPDEARLTLSSGITIQGPARLILPPDDYLVTVEAAGYAVQEARTTVESGNIAMVHLTLLPEDVTEAPSEPLQWRPLATYGLAGVGALGVLSGAYFYFETKSLADDMAALREEQRLADLEGNETPEEQDARAREYAGLQDDADGTAFLSNTSYVVGVLAIAGAAALYLTTPDEDVQADVAVSPLGVQLRLRF